eukprot:1003315-Karenia_brevis.AAC.1
MVSPFAHYDDVPPTVAEHWACAMADVLILIRDASTDEELNRALKWLLALHDILLRLPPRGGRRGRGILSHRFAAWADGNLAMLVHWWVRDRASAHRRLRPRTADTAREDVDVRRALHFMSEGDISR